jgi:FAD:protein FMN transferase
MSALPQVVTLSLHAMATRFELVLPGDDPVRLRAAGEQALFEIERLETQLSFYRTDSEITWINTRAAAGPVKIEPRLFQLLSRCAELSKKTFGAFDITVGPLMRAWGFAGGEKRVPPADVLEGARSVLGMHNVELSEEDCSIRFKRPGVELDLGGYGKGYAIERATNILRESGITSAMFHGGTSSVFAIGPPPLETRWKIALSAPITGFGAPLWIELNNTALSVSAVHGKSFKADGRTYGHVFDPRNGEPVTRARAAAVTGPSPSDCEALSTALLVLGDAWLPEMRSSFPEYQAFVA